jgi:hypothetical protein
MDGERSTAAGNRRRERRQATEVRGRVRVEAVEARRAREQQPDEWFERTSVEGAGTKRTARTGRTMTDVPLRPGRA